MRENDSRKPWQMIDGSMMSDEELKRECVGWGTEVWEEYLQTLESQQAETHLFDAKSIDEYGDFSVIHKEVSPKECANMLFSMAQTQRFKYLEAALGSCVNELPHRQRQAVRLFFYESLSKTSVAAEMNVTVPCVVRTLSTACKTLQEKLLSGIFESKAKAIRSIDNRFTRGTIDFSEEPGNEGRRVQQKALGM